MVFFPFSPSLARTQPGPNPSLLTQSGLTGKIPSCPIRHSLFFCGTGQQLCAECTYPTLLLVQGMYSKEAEENPQ